MRIGWIRLWRKAVDNEIIQDQTAWQIFTWLLLIVNPRTGERTIGRFWASEELALNSSTFYKGLKRLEKKYKVVTTKSDNKKTTIRLVNWAKYQHALDIKSEVGNNKVTTKSQQSNTLIRIKNKEKEIYKEKEKETPELMEILNFWNTTLNTSYKALTSFEDNARFWLTQYSLVEIKAAIANITRHPYWKDKMDSPVLFFRRKNPARESVDYIGEMLNLKPETTGYTNYEDLPEMFKGGNRAKSN